MIMGTFEINDMPPITTSQIPFWKIKTDTNVHSENSVSTNLSLPKKEEPRPTPYMPTEFILPSILAFRRKNSSPTMD
jgi:hypothetical protein